jgi:hypothetical protein
MAICDKQHFTLAITPKTDWKAKDSRVQQTAVLGCLCSVLRVFRAYSALTNKNGFQRVSGCRDLRLAAVFQNIHYTEGVREDDGSGLSSFNQHFLLAPFDNVADGGLDFS